MARFEIITPFILVLFLLVTNVRADQDWHAPAEEASKVNAVIVNDDVLALGKKIYLKRCQRCHGSSGLGDGSDAHELLVEPSDLTSKSIGKDSDGELFWKIKTGKRPMPKYGSRLSEEEIWSVVHYMRTFTVLDQESKK